MSPGEIRRRCIPVPIAELWEQLEKAREREKVLEARIADLEEEHWPYEWQVATREREVRKAAENREQALEQELARVRERADFWENLCRTGEG